LKENGKGEEGKKAMRLMGGERNLKEKKKIEGKSSEIVYKIAGEGGKSLPHVSG